MSRKRSWNAVRKKGMAWAAGIDHACPLKRSPDAGAALARTLCVCDRRRGPTALILPRPTWLCTCGGSLKASPMGRPFLVKATEPAAPQQSSRQPITSPWPKLRAGRREGEARTTFGQQAACVAPLRTFILHPEARPLWPTTCPPMHRWARTVLHDCFAWRTWGAHTHTHSPTHTQACALPHSRLSVRVELPVVGLLAGAAEPEAQAVSAQVQGGGGGRPAHAAQPLVRDRHLVGGRGHHGRRSERRGGVG